MPDQNDAVPSEGRRWSQLKADIIEAASTLGIDSVGFTSADPFLSLKERLLENKQKGYASGFEEPDIDKRVYPDRLFEQPRSIIAIAVAYPSKLIDPPKSEPGAYRGILARSAWGLDYHQALRNRLARLEAFIRERVPEARLESMVDTGALSDRAVALRAGIGWSGKNCAIISPQLGSWLYLGEMITNIPFEPDTPIEDRCGTCTKCLDACPTGALVAPGQLNAQRCISYLTQTKGTLSEEFMLKIGNRLYGCDTCQIVCPENRGKNWTHHPELQPDPETVKPLLVPILQMSNKEFKRKFGENASAWRGKKPIQRNAIIALGNFKDQTAVPELAKVLREDPRYELRATAAWSLGRIGGRQALEILNKQRSVETNCEVLEAIQHAEEKLGAEQTTLLYYDVIPNTPIGPLTVIASHKGMVRLDFGTFEDHIAAIERWTSRYFSNAEFIRHPAFLNPIVTQITEYFAGERKAFELALDLQGTTFQKKVWEALVHIPFGDTWSYKQVAEYIESPKAVRAVGGANNKNPIALVVPCHRVIGANGAMVGYGGGLDKKEILLSLEKQ